MAPGESREDQIAQARERADLARMKFANSLSSTRRRLAPARLKEDALVVAGDKVEDVKQDVRRTMFSHPALTLAAAAGGAAMLFWKPARHVAFVGLRAAQLVWLNRKLWSSGNDS